MRVDIKRVDSLSGGFIGINVYIDGERYEKAQYAGMEYDATIEDIESFVRKSEDPFYPQGDHLKLLTALYFLYQFKDMSS